jgi:hypothetical protein
MATSFRTKKMSAEFFSFSNPVFSNFAFYAGVVLCKTMLMSGQWWKKSEYPKRTTDHGQTTGKLYHLRLRVESILYFYLFFVIYKAGREPTSYW